ncbi:MAG: DNA gyrase/topoisomerase IV subunit A [Chitinophagales bacterium]
MAQEPEDPNKENGQTPEDKGDGGWLESKKPVSGMYQDWFIDYASYVILERAVPKYEDGLKPVQRRIMHAMKEMDDGRFNKVANIIGQTMQYHPHGDAAIGDAIVNMGQKELMIETQGNWGDIRTGDSAAAPRYIEARLSKFALEVAFNADLTEWQLSYDGRKREPIALPMKFPLLLAQGVEGIAVGLATKIMPHNFIELCKGSIDVLKGKKTKLLPDFPTGGTADFSEYNGGLRGGRIKVRAKIDIEDRKTLVIKDIPFGTTTTSLIDSILKANDKNKIKIKRVTDNTAKDVEILIELPAGISPDIAVDGLYAFTDCEISISPNVCVIIADKPHFMAVDDVLKQSTEHTLELLRMELEIKKKALEEKWHFSSLEKIFIENRIYRDIEECETWEAVIEAIDKGLAPFKKQLMREVTEEDIVRLTEIKIKRISKFDAFKADELIKKLEEDLEQIKHDLAHLTDYAIAYFQMLIDKFGKGRERKTTIATFDTIERQQVVVNNQKLYVNRAEGFVGYGLKKDEFVQECSDIDDVIAIRRDGKFMVTKVDDKAFVGKDILYAGVWNRGDERMVYNLVYFDAKSKRTYIKRFNVKSVTRDREYDLTTGAKGSKVLYLSANPNAEAEVISVQLTQGCSARKKQFDFDFSEIDIKGKGSKGNTLTKYPVRNIKFKHEGESTLGGIDIWIDESVGRLNVDERGKYLGNFKGDDKILLIYKDGSYELTNYELTNRYQLEEVEILEKFNPDHPVSVVHYDSEKKNYFVKRFLIETTSLNHRLGFISEGRNSKMVFASTKKNPTVEFSSERGKSKIKETEIVNLEEFIDVKGWKSLGNRLSLNTVKGKLKLVHEEDWESAKDTQNPEAESTESSEEQKPDDKKAPEETSKENLAPKEEKAEEKEAPKKQPLPPRKPEEKPEDKSNKLKSGDSIEWDLEKKTEKKSSNKGSGSQGTLFD